MTFFKARTSNMLPSAFPSWTLKSRPLLPVVQGGMGIGVSAHRLAGAVARSGAMGTISSVELRHHHPDLLELARNCRDQNELDRLNLTALDREILRHVRQIEREPRAHHDGVRAAFAGLPDVVRVRRNRLHYVHRDCTTVVGTSQLPTGLYDWL